MKVSREDHNNSDWSALDMCGLSLTFTMETVDNDDMFTAAQYPVSFSITHSKCMNNKTAQLVSYSEKNEGKLSHCHSRYIK